jgi:hypothetical protein
MPLPAEVAFVWYFALRPQAVNRAIFCAVGRLTARAARYLFDRRASVAIGANPTPANFVSATTAVDHSSFFVAGWAGHNWHSELFGSGEKKTPQKLPPKNKNNPSVSLVFFGEFFGVFFGLRKIELFVNFSEFFGAIILLVF